MEGKPETQTHETQAMFQNTDFFSITPDSDLFDSEEPQTEIVHVKLADPVALYDAIADRMVGDRAKTKLIKRYLQALQFIIGHEKDFLRNMVTDDMGVVDEALRFIQNGASIKQYYASVVKALVKPEWIAALLASKMDDRMVDFTIGVGPHLPLFDEQVITERLSEMGLRLSADNIFQRTRVALIATMLNGMTSSAGKLTSITRHLPTQLKDLFLAKSDLTPKEYAASIFDVAQQYVVEKSFEWNPSTTLASAISIVKNSLGSPDVAERQAALKLFSSTRLSLWVPPSDQIFSALALQMECEYIATNFEVPDVAEITGADINVSMVLNHKFVKDLDAMKQRLNASGPTGVMLRISKFPQTSAEKMRSGEPSKYSKIENILYNQLTQGRKVTIVGNLPDFSSHELLTPRVIISGFRVIDFSTMEVAATVNLKSRIVELGFIDGDGKPTRPLWSLFSLSFYRQLLSNMLNHQQHCINVLSADDHSNATVFYRKALDTPNSSVIAVAVPDMKKVRSDIEKTYDIIIDDEELSQEGEAEMPPPEAYANTASKTIVTWDW